MKSFTDVVRQAEQQDDYLIEAAKLSFVIELNRLLQKREMKFADLARSINRSPAYISKIMAGDTNLTIETMVKLVHAVGGDLNISIETNERKKENYKTKKYESSFTVSKQSAQEGHIGDYFKAFPVNGGAKDEVELIAA
ncbi:MAG: helix-turn-helix transcriptional regulator [Nitrosospira multiformis]|nr:helix-turn-helix transcriptional regulator [Nitrosospira multiformis]